MLRSAIFLVVSISPYSFASDSWRTPPAGWSKPALERLITNSPWAVQTAANMDDPSDRAEVWSPPPPVGEGQPNPQGRESSGPPGVRWDGGVSKNRRGHLVTLPVLVRWDSAAILRPALEHNDKAYFAELRAAAPDNFVITVLGLLPSSQHKDAPVLQAKSSSDDDRVRSNEEILEWFMANTSLLVKGEPEMHPQNVKVEASTGSLHLFFKRNDVLLQQKRDVLFVTRFGSMNVQARFRTKNMVVDGRPDL